MSLATQRAGWSHLPLRAAAFVALTCAAILGVSGWREWAARDAVLTNNLEVYPLRLSDAELAAAIGDSFARFVTGA